MDITLDEAIRRNGGPMRRGGTGNARPSPYGKGGGRGAGRGGGFGSGGKGGGKNVYVGNLAWTVSWQDLKDHFKTIGPVLNADVMQEADGRSKGCGLVTFQNKRDADRAIAELHDTELDGRKIFVREDRETAGGPGCKLYVGNLSPGTTWMDLKDLFREAVRARTLHTHTHMARTRSTGMCACTCSNSTTPAASVYPEELYSACACAMKA